jgi:alpha-L-arabinofuranosidase
MSRFPQEVILGVWSGIALNGSPKIVPEDQLQPYIDEVINEIHFLTDPPTTNWGALRAKYGRTAPYPLSYVEMYAPRLSSE